MQLETLGKNMNSSQYTAMVEIYYTFAYYTCCVPYKLNKENGRYKLTRWWPQRVSSQYFEQNL